MFGAARCRPAKVLTSDVFPSLPPTFLCPSLYAARQAGGPQVRQLRRSTRASTSSAPLRPSHSRRNDHVATEATDHAPKRGLQGRMARPVRGSLPQNSGPSNGSYARSLGGRKNGKADPSGGHGTNEMLAEEVLRQELVLLDTAVNDICKLPPALSVPSDDMAVLQQTEERYFTLCKGNHLHSLDLLLPNLATAYMHIGRNEETVRLLERHKNNMKSAGQTLELELWKGVLKIAFSQHKYRLVDQLVRAGSTKMDTTNNWMLYAQLEAQLRLLETSAVSADQATDSYWQVFAQANLRAPEEVFTSLLKSQIRRGRIDLAKETMRAREREGYRDSDKAWRLFLGLHPRGRRRGVLRSLAHDLGHDGASIFERLIVFLAKRQDARRIILAFRLFGIERDMDGDVSGWYPTSTTFSAATHAFCSLDNLEAVLHFLRLSSHFHKEMDANIFKRLVKMLRIRGRIRDATTLCNEMLGETLIGSEGHDDASSSALADNVDGRAGTAIDVGGLIVTPSLSSYLSAMSLCSLLENPLEAANGARSIFSAVIREGYVAGPLSYSAFAQVFERVFRNAKWTHMAAALNDLAVQEANCPPQYRAQMSGFIGTLRSHGFIDAITIKTRFRKAVPSRPQRENQEWMTKSQEIASSFVQQVKTAKSKDAEQDTESQEQHWWSPSLQKEEKTWISGVRLSSDPSVHLLPSMTSAGYALRLRVFAVVRRDHASAVVIFRHMVARGITPTSHHIAPIIEGLVLNGRLRDAQAVRDGARETTEGVNSSTRIAAAIIRGFARLGDWESVHQELTRMEQAGLKFDPGLWAIVQLATSRLWNERKEGYKSLDQTAKDALARLEPAKWQLKAEVASKSKASAKAAPVGQSTSPISQVVVKYVAMFNRGSYTPACLFMSQALDDGLVADQPLHSRLKRDFQYLCKIVQTEHRLIVDDLLRAQAPLYEVSTDHIPLQETPAGERDGDGEDKESRTVLQNNYRTAARAWAPILHLSMRNRDRTSSAHPAMVQFQKREREARQAILDLTIDVYASDTLAEEVKMLTAQQEQQPVALASDE